MSYGKEDNVDTETLFEHQSEELRFILRVMLKISQNLYAETLLKIIDPHLEGKSFAGGRERVGRMLSRAGIPEEAYRVVDGSGLSRYNLLSAEAIIRLLLHAARRDYREEFIAMLPLSGVDGTIKQRMNNSAAEGRVQAKTGTIAWVRALSGYVRTEDGELLAFSALVNNYTDQQATANFLQDTMLQILSSSRD